MHSIGIFEQAMHVVTINGGVEFGRGEGQILRHASASSTIFRTDVMYDMVRVGGLLFGTSPIDLVFIESVFWKMVATEFLDVDDIDMVATDKTSPEQRYDYE